MNVFDLRRYKYAERMAEQLALRIDSCGDQIVLQGDSKLYGYFSSLVELSNFLLGLEVGRAEGRLEIPITEEGEQND